METAPNRVQLIGYLEEALAPEDMARIEEQLRVSESWRSALLELRDEIDLGEHSVATIWRRHRLTCPSREKLWTFWAGGLVPEEEDFIRFHLEVIKCRRCNANSTDLAASAKPAGSGTGDAKQRRRFFETSIGSLPRRRR